MASTALTVSRNRQPIIAVKFADIDYDMLDAQLAKIGGGGASPFPGKQIGFDGNEGTWFIGYGDDREEFSSDVFVVMFHQVGHGFVKFEKGTAPEWKFLTDVMDPTQTKASRADCGDNDKDAWPKDKKGKAMDPWRECLIVVCRDDKGVVYHLMADAVSKRISLQKLLGNIFKVGKSKPGMLPEVEFSVTKVENKDGDKFRAPGFEIVGWVKPTKADEAGYVAADDLDDDEADTGTTMARRAPATSKEEPVKTSGRSSRDEEEPVKTRGRSSRDEEEPVKPRGRDRAEREDLDQDGEEDTSSRRSIARTRRERN